jgi:hypothetical protein
LKLSGTPIKGEIVALGQIRKKLLPEVLKIIEGKETGAGTRQIAIRLARELKGEEDWYNYIKRSIGISAKEIPAKDDDRWASLMDAYFDTLKEMHSSRKMDILRWLFELLQSQDQTTRMRIQGILEKLS